MSLGVCGVLLHFRVFNFEKRQKKIEVPESPAPLAALPPDGLSPAEPEIIQSIKSLFNTGQFSKALETIDSNLALQTISEPLRNWLEAQKPNVVISLAWTKVQANQCADAIVLFGKLADVKIYPYALKGLGYCAFKDRDVVRAEKYWNLFLEQVPDDWQTAALLVDVLESFSRFQDAVQLLEKINFEKIDAAGQQKVKDLQRSLQAKARESQDQTVEFSSLFRMTYPATLNADQAHLVVESLNDAFQEYSDFLNFRPTNLPIELVLYDGSRFKDIVSDSPSWSDGVFDGRIRAPMKLNAAGNIENWDKLRVVLRHELSHAFLYDASKGKSIPSWFDEGLAQFLSCRGNRCAAFSFGPSPAHFLTPDELNQSFVALNEIKASQSYQQSVYLVNYLYRVGHEEGLRQTIKVLGESSKITSDHLTGSFGFNFLTLTKTVSGYWDQRKYL